MTDLERWRRFLREFGIEFTEEEDVGPEWSKVQTELIMQEGGEKVTGNLDYLTSVTFDATGKFLWIGAWSG